VTLLAALRVFGTVPSPVSKTDSLSIARPSSATDVAHQDTRDPSVASPLRHTKPVAHALTQNTYGANQNEVCHKSAQENIVDDSIFNMLWLYHDDHSTLPILHSLLTRTNSALS
jgi:hypothetical protein